MAKSYRVWVEIEEYDAETDQYSDYSTDPITMELDSLQAAELVVLRVLMAFAPGEIEQSDACRDLVRQAVARREAAGN